MNCMATSFFYYTILERDVPAETQSVRNIKTRFINPFSRKDAKTSAVLTYIHSVNRGLFSAQSATLRDPNLEIGDGHPMSEHIEKAISTFLDGFS